MPLTDSQIKSATTERKTLLTDGGGLYLEVRRTQNGHCGKYFIGRTRFPATAKGSKIDVHIGTYGKGVGELSLKQAREEWEELKLWGKETGRDLRDKKRIEDRLKMNLYYRVCVGIYTYNSYQDKRKHILACLALSDRVRRHFDAIHHHAFKAPPLPDLTAFCALRHPSHVFSFVPTLH